MPLLRTSQRQETSRTQEFWETGTVVYYETVCKLRDSFLLCGCLFESFYYQSQSLKLFGGCLGLEKRGRERPTWKSVTLSSGFGRGLGHSLVFPSWLEPTNQLYSLQMDVRWCDRVWVKLGYLTKLGFVGTGITKIFGAMNFKIMIHAHPQKKCTPWVV